MDKQVKNIKLLEDGRIRFKNGRIETPRNPVDKIENGVVHFKVNKDRYVCKVNVNDYFRLSLWAHRLTLDHANPFIGVVAYDNGYEHKSLAAAIMQTTKGQKVSYKDKNHLNCCRENLVIIKESSFLSRWYRRK